MIRIQIALVVLAMLAWRPPLQAKDLSIHNDHLVLSCDPSTGQVSLRPSASNARLAIEAVLPVHPGDGKVVATSDKAFGKGKAIELIYPNGNRDTLMLFPKLPFALFRSTVTNSTPSLMVLSKGETLTARLRLPRAPKDLEVLGTGGLNPADQESGSYAWIAIADPVTRQGVVAGWLTFDRGSGVLFSRGGDEQPILAAQIDYGKLRLEPGRSEPLETLAIGCFEDARLGLEAWADAIAKQDRIKLPPQPVGYCTWYSRPHGGASDQVHVAEQASFAAQNLAPFGFSVIQIDDGWQAGISTNGPKRNFTTHSARGPYSEGMKSTADRIKAEGLTPGLWFMPFAGTWYDPFFNDHQDWFVQDASGRPYQTPWGGTSLDLTKPAVLEFLRGNIQRITHQWGFQYLKMDGLWTGTATKQMYINDAYRDDGIGDAVFHDPKKTNLEAYRTGLKLIRDTAGSGVFLLGCCTPQNMRSYGGAFGLVDAMRIGPDNGVSWKDLLRGPTYGSRQYFLQGRVWYNDPDPIYVRTNLPLNQAQLICSWVTLSGQMNLSSEWFAALPLERLDLLKRTMPSHGLLPRPVDLFEQPIPRIWLLTDTRRLPRRDVIGLFNWEDHAATIKSSLGRIGLDEHKTYAAYDYWSNTVSLLPPGELNLPVSGQSCRVLAVRPLADHPMLLSTSRHITQGMVDVREEHWSPFQQSLSGRSELVANDPYEMRVILPNTGARWSLRAIEVSKSDLTAGVRILSHSEQDGLLRVRLSSPVNREVHWALKYQRSAMTGLR
jgi:hypothetical protein